MHVTSGTTGRPGCILFVGARVFTASRGSQARSERAALHRHGIDAVNSVLDGLCASNYLLFFRLAGHRECHMYVWLSSNAKMTDSTANLSLRRLVLDKH